MVLSFKQAFFGFSSVESVAFPLAFSDPAQVVFHGDGVFGPAIFHRDIRLRDDPDKHVRESGACPAVAGFGVVVHGSVSVKRGSWREDDRRRRSTVSASWCGSSSQRLVFGRPEFRGEHVGLVEDQGFDGLRLHGRTPFLAPVVGEDAVLDGTDDVSWDIVLLGGNGELNRGAGDMVNGPPIIRVGVELLKTRFIGAGDCEQAFPHYVRRPIPE
jgi:hypothetical protein